MNHSTAYFAGVDWAKHKHDVHLTTADGTDVAHGEFSHTGVGLQAMTDWLRQHAGDAPVTVAIEMPHGAPVTALQHHGFTVASVNPMQVHHDRRHRAMSGAKDDPRDARLLAEMVRRTPDSTRTQTVELDEVVALRATVQHREQRVKDRTALITRLRSQLWEYFPELGNQTDNVSAAWFLDLCDAVPTPDAASAMTPTVLDAQLPKRRGRRRSAAALLQSLQGPTLPCAPAAVAAHGRAMQATVAQLRLCNAAIAEADAEIAAALEAVAVAGECTPTPGAAPRLNRADLDRLRSLPGIGTVVLAQLVAHGYDALVTGNMAALRALSGVAPVTHQSGRQRGVRMRRAANGHLRNAMHDMAASAAIRAPASKNYYHALRARGCRHGRALRTVADRQLRIMFAMLRDGTTFDPHRSSRWGDTTRQTNEEKRSHAL